MLVSVLTAVLDDGTGTKVLLSGCKTILDVGGSGIVLLRSFVSVVEIG